ncbi:MAG: hypothetical protein KI792_07360 [Alphaproteobacteria bacterium]|nr:hypothetical protein [Alphaproteobacteria bacterium SS10]
MDEAIIRFGEALFGSDAVSTRNDGTFGDGIAFILVAAFCYIVGLLIMVQSLVRLSRASQFSGGFSPTQSLYAGPIVGFLVAGLLIGLPGTFQTVNETIFLEEGANNILSYRGLGDGFGAGGTVIAFADRWNQVVIVLILIVQLVGWIAFVRGILMLKRAAEGSGQASYGTAATHILGGVMAANVIALVDLIQETICDSKCLVAVT